MDQGRRQRVLVCGATGFIGRNLVEALSRRSNLEIYALRFSRPTVDVPNVTWRQADLRDVAAVNSVVQGMDVVIQAAATTSGARDIVHRPHIHVTDNAVMNSLLLRACHDHKVRHFVFFSCSVMYQPRSTPWREEEWDAAQEMHLSYFGAGWTKVYIEKMCEFFSRLGVTRHTVIRHTNVFGPHDKFDLERSHVLGATVTKAMTSRDGKVLVWGTGEEARDLIYVDDLVRFVELAVDRQKSPYEMVHVSSGRVVTIRKLVEQVIAASGRSLRIEYDASRPTIKTAFALDNQRAFQRFGWKPEVSFEEGVRHTVRWWCESFNDGRPA
ncbi:MAG TPA: NAD-dependent epimerase/dehydratase family protein [Reyranella sp.]|nr:NAD-dependent epimerase/dehydratase family protein [Reyranella sp.]